MVVDSPCSPHKLTRHKCFNADLLASLTRGQEHHYIHPHSHSSSNKSLWIEYRWIERASHFPTNETQALPPRKCRPILQATTTSLAEWRLSVFQSQRWKFNSMPEDRIHLPSISEKRMSKMRHNRPTTRLVESWSKVRGVTSVTIRREENHIWQVYSVP